jgi:hypothetical protein
VFDPIKARMSTRLGWGWSEVDWCIWAECQIGALPEIFTYKFYHDFRRFLQESLVHGRVSGCLLTDVSLGLVLGIRKSFGNFWHFGPSF